MLTNQPSVSSNATKSLANSGFIWIEPAKVYFFVKDDADEIVAAYGHNGEPLQELREALTKAAE